MFALSLLTERKIRGRGCVIVNDLFFDLLITLTSLKNYCINNLKLIALPQLEMHEQKTNKSL